MVGLRQRARAEVGKDLLRKPLLHSVKDLRRQRPHGGLVELLVERAPRGAPPAHGPIIKVRNEFAD